MKHCKSLIGGLILLLLATVASSAADPIKIAAYKSSIRNNPFSSTLFSGEQPFTFKEVEIGNIKAILPVADPPPQLSKDYIANLSWLTEKGLAPFFYVNTPCDFKLTGFTNWNHAWYSSVVSGRKIFDGKLSFEMETPSKLTDGVYLASADNFVFIFGIDSTPPSSPESLSYLQTKSGIELKWKAAEDITSGIKGYNIYFKPTAFDTYGRFNENLIATTIATIPAEALADGNYLWYIEAANEAGLKNSSTNSSFSFYRKTGQSAAYTGSLGIASSANLSSSGKISILSGPRIDAKSGETRITDNLDLPSTLNLSLLIADSYGVDPDSIEIYVDESKSPLPLSIKEVKNITSIPINTKIYLKEGTHTLKISAKNRQGKLSFISFTGLKVKAADARVIGKPMNYPNPFKPASGEQTKIVYTLSDDAFIKLMVFDMAGKVVWQNEYDAGTMGGLVGENEIKWNGRSYAGNVVGNGVYYYFILSNNKTLARGEAAVGD